MPVIISLLRAVNVGPNDRMKMDKLRAVYASAGLRDPQTYVQSGNVVFRHSGSLAGLSARIEDAIAAAFGFRPPVILRTLDEWRAVIDANPFTNPFEPSKLLVTFLASDPGEEARKRVREIPVAPEELRIQGREIYIYYPNGAGRSKLPVAAIDRALKTPGTARNWNSVLKILEMAREMEK